MGWIGGLTVGQKSIPELHGQVPLLPILPNTFPTCIITLTPLQGRGAYETPKVQ